MQLNVNLPGYEDLTVDLNEQGFIIGYHLQGSIKTVELFHQLKEKFGDEIIRWPNLVDERTQLHSRSPQERRSLLLLQELVLKAQGRKNVPYSGEIVCECRQVSSETIDKALLASASSVEEVAAWTTACTSCTSCKSKIEEIIQYRFPNKSA